MSDHVFGIAEIVALLRRRPELVALNAGLSQGYWERTRELAQLEYRVSGTTHRVEV